MSPTELEKLGYLPAELEVDNVSVGYGKVSLAFDSYMHIQEVEVFTGNDDADITDRVSLKSIKDGKESYKLSATRMIDILEKPKAPGRLRGEPGVCITMKGEESEADVKLIVHHHKGSVYVRAYYKAEDIDKYDVKAGHMTEYECRQCRVLGIKFFESPNDDICVGCKENLDEVKKEVGAEDAGEILV